MWPADIWHGQMAKFLRKLWDGKKRQVYGGEDGSFGKRVDHVFVLQSVLQQVLSLYQSEFFTKCIPELLLSIYSSNFNLMSSSSSLRLLLRLPVASIRPSIFPSLTYFRVRFNWRRQYRKYIQWKRFTWKSFFFEPRYFALSKIILKMCHHNWI